MLAGAAIASSTSAAVDVGHHAIGSPVEGFVTSVPSAELEVVQAPSM
jgi:hypothetical protein